MGITVAATVEGPIEYADVGTGPVVLLLHGACANARERVIHPPIARAGFRIIIPSRPGHGGTPSTVGRSTEDAAAALAGLLARLAIRRVLVVAVGTGAPTGAALAAGYPGLVAGLVLESAPFDALPAGTIPCAGRAGRRLELVAAIAPRIAAARLLAATSMPGRRGTRDRPRRADCDAVRRFLHDRDARADAAGEDLHAVGDEVLAAIRVPTLVVHGRRDRVAPFGGARRAHALVAGSRLFASATGGHLLWLGQGAEETTQRVIAFLKRCSAAILAPS